MMTSYGFRKDAVRGLLKEAKQFQNVTYVSATPITKEYWFDEMLGLDE